ncbi:MAG: hypothetical protein INF92_11745 [Rhodobacter sp.]|nr:hypothetical protein [Rhodobacter sp.]
MPAATCADTLIGHGGDDDYVLFNGADKVVEVAGGGTNDRILTDVSFILAPDDDIERVLAYTVTSTAAVNLTANAIAQTLAGNNGNNRLDGREGIDNLTGLAGNDTFVFSTSLGTANIDRITDFGLGDDRIELKASIFTALSTGSLASTGFASNTTGVATTTSHRILYESDTGFLFYDADGTGTTQAVRFATLRACCSHSDSGFP